MLYNIIKSDIADNINRYCNFNEEASKTVISLVESSWVSGANSVSIPHVSKLVGDAAIRKITFALSEAGWLTSTIKGNFGSIALNTTKLNEHLTEDEQAEFRRKSRINKYRLRCEEDLQPSNLTRTPSGIRDTGLDRPGFAHVAHQKFQFDTGMMVKYRDAIILNGIKGMNKMAERHPEIHEDKANYGIICAELVDYYIFHPENWYNMEANYSDQRGRSILEGLNKFFNFIANKDARACTIAEKGVIVEATNKAQMNDIWLFIAELVGTKTTNWAEKAIIGERCYSDRDLHDIDLDTEHGRSELHENIWLERIYARLDTLFDQGYVYWDIPLEMDFTASMLGIMGILTGDAGLVDQVNIINSQTLLDPWTVEGMPREMVKAVATPTLYGSNATPRALIKNKGMVPTKEELKLANKMMRDGKFAVAKAFKSFFIDNAHFTTPIVKIKILDEEFEYEISKVKYVGADVNAYSAYDTVEQRHKVFINHDPVSIPDYDRASLWSATGLVHNRDSKIQDDSMYEIIANRKEWALSIHDAALVLPGTSFRQVAMGKLKELQTNKDNIVKDYRASIGATDRKADVEWLKLQELVTPLDESTPFEPSCLK